MDEVELKRRKAHFHRLLGPLLQELAAWEDTHWLETQQQNMQHTLTPDGELNTYGRALYCLDSLEPYKARLDELQAVQDSVLRDFRPKRTPHALLLPRIYQDVRHARVHRSTYHASITQSRATILERIDAAIATTRQNYNRHAEHSLDDKTRSIGDEIAHHNTVREWVRNSPEKEYRVRIKEARYRPYLYFLDGSTLLAETRQHGLILVGHNIKVERVDHEGRLRRERSDKMTVKPLWHYGVTSVYPESLWQEAKAEKEATT